MLSKIMWDGEFMVWLFQLALILENHLAKMLKFISKMFLEIIGGVPLYSIMTVRNWEKEFDI